MAQGDGGESQRADQGKEDYPCTVIVSKEEDGKGVWTDLLEDNVDQTREFRREISGLGVFEDGEIVMREDWFHPLS